MADITGVEEFINLRDNNPYSIGRVILFDDGTAELERDFIVYKGNARDKYHTVKKNETIDFIAWQWYKDVIDDATKYWWVICDANNIENPLDLSGLVGTEILIPDILNFQLIYNQ